MAIIDTLLKLRLIHKDLVPYVKIYRAFLNQMRKAYLSSVGSDVITKLGFILGIHGKLLGQTNIKPTKFERLIIDLFEPSNSTCLMILGRRDTGKTDLSLYIMEVLHKFNVISEFATNIRVYEPPFHIEYITNLEDLETWCRTSPNKKLFVLDEAGKSLRRRTPMSGLNVRLLDNLQILRKYRLSLIFIAPHEKYVDAATLGSDVLDAVIVKPYPRSRKIALYQNLLEETEFWITEIPPTQLRFNTWDIAPFTLHRETKQKPKFEDKQLQIFMGMG